MSAYLKGVFFMKRITVNKVSRSTHVIKVSWSINGLSQDSNFYFHQDGSWGFDPAFSHQSSTVQAIVWALVNDHDMPAKASRSAILRYDY